VKPDITRTRGIEFITGLERKKSRQAKYGVRKGEVVIYRSDDLAAKEPAMADIRRDLLTSEKCPCLVSISQALLSSPLYGLIGSVLEEVLAVCGRMDAELESDSFPANPIPAGHGCEKLEDILAEDIRVLATLDLSQWRSVGPCHSKEHTLLASRVACLVCGDNRPWHALHLYFLS
jgi:hypothetical protein